MINSKKLFEIQLKYLNILKYLEEEGLLKQDYWWNYKSLIIKHNNKELFIYPNIKIIRESDYVECGNYPDKYDTMFDFKVNFNFNLAGNHNFVKKWIDIIHNFEHSFHKHKSLINVNCKKFSWEKLDLKLDKDTDYNLRFKPELDLIFNINYDFEYIVEKSKIVK